MILTKYQKGLQLSGERVCALGFFDGVHLGHRDMLARARSLAEKRGIEFALFTFSSESRKLKGGGGRIYDTKTRLTLFEELGIQRVILCDFDDVCDISHECFVKDILIGALNTTVAVSGFNFRYGKGAEGTAETLAQQMEKYARYACIVPPYFTEDGEILSTTKIKLALARGDIGLANALLGSPYFLASPVEEGLHLGRTYGIPTLNQSFPEGSCLPLTGVYRTAVILGDGAYHGVTNVGTCPTFGERPVHAETFIVGEGFSLYGECVKVVFLGYLRKERTFDSAESLKMQILVDKNKTTEQNGDIQWLATGHN